jgi:hypothetical protein
MESLFDLFGNGRGFQPHGYCLLWYPGLLWTHVLADALIAAAYFSIPVAIVRFVTKRQDIAFSWIFWLFALFIIACGTSGHSTIAVPTEAIAVITLITASQP